MATHTHQMGFASSITIGLPTLSCEKERLRRVFLEFLLRGMSYPRKPCSGRQCVNVVVCIYWFLLGFSRGSYYWRLAPIQKRASVIAYRAVHSVTLCPVETSHPHQKHTLSRYYFTTIICTIALFQVSSDVCAFGGGGENRTPVQNTFLFASYSNTSIIHYLLLQDK